MTPQVFHTLVDRGRSELEVRRVLGKQAAHITKLMNTAKMLGKPEGQEAAKKEFEKQNYRWSKLV